MNLSCDRLDGALFLRVRLTRPGDKRPTEFSAKAGSGQFLIVFKGDPLGMLGIRYKLGKQLEIIEQDLRVPTLEEVQKKVQQERGDEWPWPINFIRWALFEAPWYSQLALGFAFVTLLFCGMAYTFCKDPEKQTATNQQAEPSTQQSKSDSVKN
jgi:hypothetical protein